MWLIVANHSSQPNSIVRWEAWLKKTDGTLQSVRVPEGQGTDAQTKQVIERFNVIPFGVPSHGAADCLLNVFDIKRSEFAHPLDLKIRAADMYGKQFECWCTHVIE